ncbi:DUF4465 domain-containing protein [Desulfobotulus sp.]|uniref:DUF4465 domain-containing protein n=1 Tax=Desulfobotulus sp. TaxID=1940337 RepID=UPI002A36B402|nr:DUF4465 domain-containing protein [Desulfobotulus sp.]MDY0162997.1 DUF4465 domain-containing protein [Desulfobotulus sp.]
MHKPCMMKIFVLGMLVLFAPLGIQADGLVSATFEDVDRSLLQEGYWNGSDESGGIHSGAMRFLNTYNKDWQAWSGFAVSTHKDASTEGYENQYSAIPGEGVEGSETYALAYAGGEPPAFVLDAEATLSGMYVTNTTYAYFSMKKGDDFAKKFDTGDWFRLRITGWDSAEKETGSVDVYLADFRESKREILDTWQWVDLSSLGKVKRVSFALDSTDKGEWGMNTPAYFALDNVGEPRLSEDISCFLQSLGF